MKLTVTEAKRLTGGLGSPSKMPGLSYGLPAAGAKWVPSICAQLGLPVPPNYGCPVGAKLAEVAGTVCHGCYADERGMYRLTNPKAAQVRRLLKLHEHRHTGKWISAMVFLINRSKEPYFRWHDSGDLLGLWHLLMITEVCRGTPKINHWLPTREAKLIAEIQGHARPKGQQGYPMPPNLTIRVSATKVDAPPPKAFKYTSTVDKDKAPIGYSCPAPKQGNQCGACRECWLKRMKNVSYHYH